MSPGAGQLRQTKEATDPNARTRLHTLLSFSLVRFLWCFIEVAIKSQNQNAWCVPHCLDGGKRQDGHPTAYHHNIDDIHFTSIQTTKIPSQYWWHKFHQNEFMSTKQYKIIIIIIYVWTFSLHQGGIVMSRQITHAQLSNIHPLAHIHAFDKHLHKLSTS